MMLKAAAVAVALCLLLFIHVPANRRRDGYAKNLVDGVAKLNAGDIAGARVLLQEAVTLRPDKAEPHLVLALALVQLGQRDDAAREFQEALRIKPALAEYKEAKALRIALGQPEPTVH
jgi:Tfp pilus assembly protein PilF